MIEAINRFSPETGKPNPVSVKEFYLMDRHEQRVFIKPLTKKEQLDFGLVYAAQAQKLPLEKRREYTKAFVAKLEKRDNKTIGDKLELAWAKMALLQVSLPEKKPIFFRKLRMKKEKPWPKWLQEKKSPYLITS